MAMSSGGFPTTHWSLITAASTTSNGQSGQQALDSLCRTYWGPVFAYIRRRGHAREDAQELTQEFFARLLERNWLGDANRDRGRFRSFLLGAVNHFLSNQWHHSQRLKRGGGLSFVSADLLDESDWMGADAKSNESPEVQFDQRWLQALLGKVLERLKLELSVVGKAQQFEVLKVFLTESPAGQSYAEAAALLAMSESGVRTAIWRLRQRYGEIFREEVAQTVRDPSEVENEIRHLLSLLGSGQ